MGKEALKKADELIALLVTPTNITPGVEKSWFLSILQNKIKEYSQAVDGAVCLNGDESFDYVRCCVNALVNLKLQLINAVAEEQQNQTKGPRLEADVLSISEQRNVSGLLEMVVVMGILPNLLQGVGVPAHKRSDFLQSVLKDMPERSLLEQYKQLVYALESLLDLAKHRSFSTLLLTKHIGDILAALLQISSAPLMKPVQEDTEEISSAPLVKPVQEDAEEISIKEDSFVMTKELHSRLTGDQERYGKELTRIVERSYQPLVVKHLLVLHGNAKDKRKDGKPAPKWFSKKVSEILTARLTAKQGVVNVIRGVLDIGGDAEALDWQKIGLVAAVLGNPPEGSYASIETYYQLICPQLLEILNHEDKVYQMIACASIKTVSERSLILSRRYLLDVLFAPFMKLCESKEEVGLAVTEQELDDCLKSVFKVFVIGTDPCLMFLMNLEKIVLVLLELHSTIALGASHLRDPVKQIIMRYLKHTDTGNAILTLRGFALCEVPEDRKGRMLQLHKDLMFGTGEEGGVRVLPRVSADQSFYLSDDEKSIIVQDLMDDLKDERLKVDFYMSLMSDLTDIMVVEAEPEPDLPAAQPGQGVESQLLDLECHMDLMMHRMRRNLMVIRLLGLLSEDKVLQDNLLKESQRMIAFIGATLKRGAMSVKSEPSEEGVMAVQSLNMALSILSLHLTQANVSVSDWERMAEYTTDLEVLSCHPDTRISRIAGQLHQLVTAQVSVLTETKNIRDKTAVIQAETAKLKDKAQQLRGIQKDGENQQMDERKKQIHEKAEELKKAKADRRKGKGLKEEEAEMKIVEDKTGMSGYEAALYDIGDPLLPVRGHGIIELTKLIDNKDAETLTNIGKVEGILVGSLEDDDTYIYLSSISGLVSCVRYSTESVLTTLTREFTNIYSRKNLPEDRSMEVRTKVGEALVRSTKELGEMTPKYKNLLLNAFFSAGNDPDELVRASSLSNLGEVCRNLRFSLGNITGELMAHLETSARDKSSQVRRAAAMVLTMILEGLGRDAFTVLESALRDILRSLRLRLGVETDEVTLVHINLALDEIDNIVRDLFTQNLA